MSTSSEEKLIEMKFSANNYDCGCRVLSPNEQHVFDEMKGNTKYREGRERIYKILDSFQGTEPKIDIERAKYFTESMKETEGEMLILRWAKALQHICANITVYIDDDALLAGRVGRSGRYGILYPELDGNYFESSVELLRSRDEASYGIEPEDLDTIMEMGAYWRDKAYDADLYHCTPAETRKIIYDPNNSLETRFIVDESSSHRSAVNWTPDYERVLNIGFSGIKKEAEEKLLKLDPLSPRDTIDKKPFLEAIIIMCDAIILWANRHAVLAKELAEKESDSVRKQELLEMAERCEWVPENPPRDFQEALQAQWFSQLFSRLEQKTGAIVSNGRMDQYLYPYYKADVDAGKLTDEEAMEWLECMWVQMAQFCDLCLSPTGSAFQEGYAHWESVTIGGQTRDGMDAVNELSYLFLRSKREFPFNYPDLAARIHAGTSDRFIKECIDTIKEGSGFPKLINDEEVIPLLLSKGARFEDAYDYCLSGCTEVRMPRVETFTSPCTYVNFASSLEMTLYNGRTWMNGSELIGLETGDPEDFKTWEEFWDAYVKQTTNLIHHAFTEQMVVHRLRAKHFACPFNSALQPLCMDACIDLHQPKIPGGIDLGFWEVMGYATATDSLAAIKKLVYDDKILTMKEVVDALKCNFEGKEIIKQMMINAPKYGNNDSYVDSIAKDIDKIAVDFTKKYTEQTGIELDVRYVPVTAHVPFGKVVGATPNGREAGFPLSDGASASQGADTNGPTAVLLSNFKSKNYGERYRASRLLNLKFTPSAVAGEDGTEKLLAFVRAWCSMKLWHVQFNIVNKETLVAAQKEPEKYKSLIVRVAGYSAYFCELSKGLQDEIIARTGNEAIS